MKSPVVPAPDEQLDRLEALVDAAVARIARLEAENRELAQKLADAEKQRKNAARRLDALLDKIEEAS